MAPITDTQTALELVNSEAFQAFLASQVKNSMCFYPISEHLLIISQGTQDPLDTLPHADPPIGSQLYLGAAVSAKEEADDSVVQGSDDWHPLPDFDKNFNIIPT